MVSQVSTAQALRYIQGMPTTDQKTSVLKDTFSPVSLGLSTIFSGTPQYLIKNRKEIAELGIKTVDGNLKQIADAAKSTAGSTPEKVGIFKKLGNSISKLIPESIKNSGLGKLVGKYKVGASMVAFDVAIGTVTEVIPAFKKLGAGEGFKQIGKTVTQAVGYAAGYAGGTALGAKIGGIIGTAGGPLGTAIGTLLGMVGGALVSGIVKKVTGPSASEKIAKKQEEEQAAMVEQDPQAMAELQQLVAQQVAQDQAAGNVTEDTQRMAAYAQTANTASTATYAAPTFTGTTSTTGATNTIDTTGTYNPFTTSSMYNGNITLADPNMYAVPSSHYEQQSNFSAVA